ncbi:MAG: glycoside hydrolase family 172 protein, partial [Actinomycetota bacterium]
MPGLSSLPRLRPGVRRKRASTWDRTGGNTDSILIFPGTTAVLAEDSGPGQVTHIWTTVMSPDLYWGRNLVLRAYWDGEESPSVEVPFGDFFGGMNCVPAPFTSAVLSIAPRDASAMNCWFPMPFADGFRITLENQGGLPVFALYAYVDYEVWPESDPTLGRFHAWWNHSRCQRVIPEGLSVYEPGLNASDKDNHLFLEAKGRGHFVGTTLGIYSDEGGWYGEGDDMIFVDSDSWPPALHGTGTEDYFGTAWGPATVFNHPYNGQPVAEREDFAGFTTVYRFHVPDPIPFEQSLRASIEHGHANDRGDDYCSVAYWYQLDRTEPLPVLPSAADRRPPWPETWHRRAEAFHAIYSDLMGHLEVLADADERGRYVLGVVRAAHLVAKGDWEGIDQVCAWLRGDPTPAQVAPTWAAPAQTPAKAPAQAVPAAGTAVEAAFPAVLEELRVLDDAALTVRLETVDANEIVDAVLGVWVADFDAAEARGMDVTFGFRLGWKGEEYPRQLIVREGRCDMRRGSEGYERMAMASDLVSFLRFTLDQLDAWEALLRGRIRATGDSA